MDDMPHENGGHDQIIINVKIGGKCVEVYL